jgi:hypothetical protein
MSDILDSNWRFILYPLSFLIPLFGVIYGVIQLMSYEKAVKKWGKVHIIIGIIGIVTYCVITSLILLKILS